MAEADKTNGRTGMTGRLRGVLFVSLALNLIVAGLIIGALLSGGGPGRYARDHHDGRDGVTPYTRAMNETQKREIRTSLRGAFDNRADRQAQRPDLEGDYRAALDVLRTDPFDAAAMTEILDRQSNRAETRRKIGQTVLSDFISAMTPEERLAYAERLQAEIDALAKRRARWSRD